MSATPNPNVVVRFKHEYEEDGEQWGEVVVEDHAILRTDPNVRFIKNRADGSEVISIPFGYQPEGLQRSRDCVSISEARRVADIHGVELDEG